jgi:hypothetical protein
MEKAQEKIKFKQWREEKEGKKWATGEEVIKGEKRTEKGKGRSDWRDEETPALD